MAYNSLLTYLVLINYSIAGESILVKYEKELAAIKKYFFSVIKNKKYENKLIFYLSLSIIYAVQKKYDQALAIQSICYKYIKKYGITNAERSLEIIDSYIGLIDMSGKYKEGILYIKTFVDSNVYSSSYRKSYIYFLYQLGDLMEIRN